MIDLTADHIGFVVASYTAAILVLGGVIGSAIIRGQRLKRELHARGLADSGEKDDRA